jgi:hypothetical protein
MRIKNIDTNCKSLPYETDSYFRKYQYIDTYILLCENKIMSEESFQFSTTELSGTFVSTDYLICRISEDFIIEEVEKFSDVREVVLTSANSTGYKYRVVKADTHFSGTSPNFIDFENMQNYATGLSFLYEKYPLIRFMWIGGNVKKNILNHKKTIITVYDTVVKKNALLLLDSDLNIISKTFSSIPDYVLSIGNMYIGAVAINKSFTKWSINQYNENLDIIDSFVISGTDLILAEFQNTCVLIYNDFSKYSSEQKTLRKSNDACIGPCTALAIYKD